MKHWLIHAAVFILAQVVFILLGFSWPWEVLSGRQPASSVFSSIDGQLWTANTSRIWTIVWLVDTIVSLGSRAAGQKATAQKEVEEK
ncbi:hypothetical protein [Renibacterium salmoninarum]|uniref:hypothetical protein n=1 Tax=Renibacterium salmoninarum TaxID=1646 RepID=UPI0002F6FFC7|nr:hypothetical protein [Renibacterium salmoninarum]